MELGLVTGFSIGPNRNGEGDVLLLQVEVTDFEDIQTVELMSPAGEDSRPPNGSFLSIIQVGDAYKLAVGLDDLVEPDGTLVAGEKKVYSSDGGVVAAFITLLKTGIIEINGNGDFAVKFTALNTALQTFITDLNAKLVTAFLAVGGAWPGTSLDISAAKEDTVKLP